MIGSLGSIAGMRIFYNPLCLETTTEPTRRYRIPRWQSARKAALIQKKWNKRFGFVKRPCMYQAGDKLFAHPSLKPKLEQAISAQGEKEGK